MTFNETYFDFSESIEAIEDEIEDVKERLDGLEEGNPIRPQLANRRTQLASQRKGAVWARDRAYESDDFEMWDEDVDGVTLGAVRAGTMEGIETEASSRDGGGAGLLLIADGTVEAPYIDGDMSDTERAAVVGQLHPYFRKWAEARIDELFDPEGNALGSSDSPKEN